MAHCFGMRTVWVESADEVPYREPDDTIDALPSRSPVLDGIRGS
jgi:hypothetical protein